MIMAMKNESVKQALKLRKFGGQPWVNSGKILATKWKKSVANFNSFIFQLQRELVAILTFRLFLYSQNQKSYGNGFCDFHLSWFQALL